MGAKSLYLDNRSKYQEQVRLANDIKAQSSLDRGLERYHIYKNTWETLNLDDLVDKLFENPIYMNNGQKFEITDPNSNYIIYCDNGGSYFRIGDKRIPKSYKGHFLSKNLESVLNVEVDGRIVGASKAVREGKTHFKMHIKRKE